MNQYIICLTNGNDEKSIISSNRDHTISQFKFIRDSFPKENMRYELREYRNAFTNDYKLINI